uniref:Uncharacterized protein LOC104230709 isoform X2 n=1 Tax=Nicotiana sylvestris TaxID=4096 RepID=A0A1U7WPM1_NICSY|nr:PREDICTED: uncharacterized protein LOC104230709 isoform X2 [Nicotiana sylvestris]XP_009781882.1 PREDICTED: uncharacterized protein LOC104230709 isoform X2 [Nicotiana sylvestris]XP_009781883.1 PREDICTED: uncharacterized protein LOC104230709 isoform X2 [Nicotiana sylvestris]XP_009781884.1 PREDICTED: uncharacterized protein LOC104230709 isoform X2 [Nicotiana sylvestris]XP_009781885.1 PREDICTED: uncharacterized protein LOC104230709 isoform X2 [Nicotiana sylvestris]
MSDSTSHKRVTRGIPTKVLNFDGPSSSLQIIQAELEFAGVSTITASERRTKLHNDKLKEAQVEKSSKETTLPVAEKRKKPMDDASCVKGKEVDAKKSSDTRDKKGTISSRRAQFPLSNSRKFSGVSIFASQFAKKLLFLQILARYMP